MTGVTGAELGQLAGEFGSQRTRHVTRAGELTEQIGQLRAGGHDAPPVPPTRSPGIRDGRPGAPLWRVTDFAPGLADDERAGVEAALEAAGILDAWVTPDGNLVNGDVVVVSGLAPVAGESCASLLVPAHRIEVRCPSAWRNIFSGKAMCTSPIRPVESKASIPTHFAVHSSRSESAGGCLIPLVAW